MQTRPCSRASGEIRGKAQKSAYLKYYAPTLHTSGRAFQGLTQPKLDRTESLVLPFYSPCDLGSDLFETQFLICKVELITSSQGFSEEENIGK